jgi:hypothetical protein
MMNPSASDISRAVELVRTPESLRDADEQAFLLQFQQEHLQFGDADPSSVAAKLSTQPLELFEIYQALRTEELRRNPPAEQPEVYAFREEETAPVTPIKEKEPKKHTPKRVKAEVAEDDDMALLIDAAEKEISDDEDEKKKPKEKKYARGDAPSSGPRTAQGSVMATLDQHGMLDDDAARDMVSRDNGTKWKDRANTAVKVTLAGLLALGGYFGVRAALATKKAAEDVGGKVEQIQDRVGQFAEDISANPHSPLPGQGKHTAAEQEKRAVQKQGEQGKKDNDKQENNIKGKGR